MAVFFERLSYEMWPNEDVVVLHLVRDVMFGPQLIIIFSVMVEMNERDLEMIR